MFLKNFSSEFSYIEVRLTDQNSRALEIFFFNIQKQQKKKIKEKLLSLLINV